MGATRLADEHRIGLKPLLRRVWAPRGQRPLARVRHRFAWRSLALPGGLCPSGLGPHPLPLGDQRLHCALRGRVGRVCPRPRGWPAQADRAGARPGGVETPECAPAGALACPSTFTCSSCRPIPRSCSPPSISWALRPLTNTVLHNRQFATSEELEDTQFARCFELQHRPDVIRSTTSFHWWPQRIRKRQGPMLK